MSNSIKIIAVNLMIQSQKLEEFKNSFYLKCKEREREKKVFRTNIPSFLDSRDNKLCVVFKFFAETTI